MNICEKLEVDLAKYTTNGWFVHNLLISMVLFYSDFMLYILVTRLPRLFF